MHKTNSRTPLTGTRRAKFSLSESSEDPSEQSICTQYTEYTDLEEDTDSETRDRLGMLVDLPQGNGVQKMSRSPSCFSTQTNQSCSNLGKCEQVLKSYTKLKIYFTVLCVVNIIIILLVCVFFAVFFLRIANTEHDLLGRAPQNDNLKSPEGQESVTGPVAGGLRQTQNDHSPFLIHCALLRHKLNVSITGRKDGFCGSEDLIEAFKQYAKPREYNEHTLINWEQKNSGNTKRGISHRPKSGVIIIQSDGFYFVYSRIAFSVSSPTAYRNNPRLNIVDIQHSIRKKQLGHQQFEIIQETSVNCANHSFVHSSYLQRAIYLRSGDELKTTISSAGVQQYAHKYNDENYFGAFKL
ncbi:hypothetical protein FSP39_025426 [Pinctada imbricata]|uniref:THD domain-containing protein n=1 Tax=Pinctada imbricata TaxID=66713 RepID=A0AA88Y251_PINIB|nr:hypothetical protein FSP39_025426 [Pinctada imbricata]